MKKQDPKTGDFWTGHPDTRKETEREKLIRDTQEALKFWAEVAEEEQGERITIRIKGGE
jgi:polyphosphate kinase 2 (PPK2 family)